MPELLRQVAAMITAELRAIDTIARLGGNEFGILLHYLPARSCEFVKIASDNAP